MGTSMPPKLGLDELNRLIACPVPTCRVELALNGSTDIRCHGCGETYRQLKHTVDLTPSSWKQWSELWPVWEKLQANGLTSYTHDPEHNLGVGERHDYLQFSQFCGFDGLVLDIGCGPQTWPAHYTHHSPRTRFVGIDPLIADAPSDYVQFRGLGEYLPFRDNVFDHVVFATSLDHMLDVRAALREAMRVCRPGGQITIWSGEKKPGAPRPQRSPEWYQQLEVPEGAEDPFHLRRFPEEEGRQMFDDVGMQVAEAASLPVDAWRTNHFYRIVKRAA